LCSICGIIDYERTPSAELLEKMGRTMKHRGPDATELFSDEAAALHHNRLAVMDPENGRQPMRASFGGRDYVIVYNGEIYNSPELRRELSGYGVEFQTNCDTETVLWSYIIFGSECPGKLNGIFAFCVYELQARKAFFARDRLGVKPFFYTQAAGNFLFASEMKALLVHPDVSHWVDLPGIWQLLFLTPVTLSGGEIFRDISELRPAECGEYSEAGLRIWSYWRLEARPWTGSAEDAAEETHWILADAVRRQMVSDVPLCTFLSGGLDSSVLTALAAEYCEARGETLATYSFEYEGNRENFRKSLFQPEGDDAFAANLAVWLGTDHTVLTAPNEAVARCLTEATLARDFPGQADIDSSLLYFCRRIRERHTVALSGECADEIFGGYPWFYRPEMLYRDFFPWIHAPMERPSLFRKEFARPEEGYGYLAAQYRAIRTACPTLPGDSDDMRTARIATCLSVSYFMTSLLERKDRMSMASGLEVRVPFADHRLLEFVYNVPWEIKFEGGVEKALLRNAARGLLPDRILHRKKSPYPKTHAPEYRQLVFTMLKQRLEAGSPLSALIDRKALRAVLEGDDVTWFGQLMSTPQLLAWLIQFDCFLEEYQVILEGT